MSAPQDPWHELMRGIRCLKIEVDESIVTSLLTLADAARAADAARHQAERIERQSIHNREVEMLRNDLATLRATVDQQAETIRQLRGAIAADEERLRHAAEKAGVLYVGCDTADAMADRCARLTAALKDARWHLERFGWWRSGGMSLKNKIDAALELK